jgi:hypothetical protein
VVLPETTYKPSVVAQTGAPGADLEKQITDWVEKGRGASKLPVIEKLSEKSSLYAASAVAGINGRSTELNTLSTASGKQLRAIVDSGKQLLTAKDAFLTAMQKEDWSEMAAQGSIITSATSHIDTLVASVENLGMAAAEAGINLLEDTKSSLSSALSGLMHGDADEDKGVFETFAYRLVDDFTNSYIDTLSKSFSEKLLDPAGGIGKFIMGLGEGGAKLGQDTAAAATGEEVPSLNSFSSAFTNFTDGISGIFGGALDGIGGIFTWFGSSFMSIVQGLLSMLSSSGGGSSGKTNWLGIGMSILGAFGGGSGGSSGGISSWFSGGGTSSLPIGTMVAATGGLVTGPGSGTSDSIHAMLSNREFVVNAAQTAKFLPLLTAINTPGFSRGGLVGGSPSNISLGRNNSQVININITGDVSRQTKAEIYKMLPNIAMGVNAHNREKGI